MTFALRRTEDVDEVQRLNMLLIGNHLTDLQLVASAWWLALAADGESAGFCGARPDVDGDWVYLIRAGVCEGFRGHGLQRRMIDARLRWARQHTRARRAITYTLPENVPSANNLIARGFRLYTPAEDWAGEGSLHWERPL